jgi:hypothetical protein
MKLLFLAILVILFACKKRYYPALKEIDLQVLIVEGNIDPGSDSTFVRLTRPVKVNDTTRIRVENNAEVIIEGRDNTARKLTLKGNGFYVSSGLQLTIGNDYRLRVKTAAGEEYLSDYVQAKRSPDIDSVSWSVDTMGLHFYVNTHDPSAATRYYRWDCVEAWEIRMPYYAEVMYANGIIRRARWPEDNMWLCWQYDSTQSLILANSERLTEDIISFKEVKKIPYHHRNVHWQYGILVKQYAIDEPAFKFFSLMKENTEAIGNLFSPLPFELRGNIRSVKDSSQYAVGYITCSTVSKKAKTVTGPELIYWRSQSPGIKCEDSVILVKVSNADFRFYYDQLGYMPIKEVFDFDGNLVGYSSSKPECIDCRSVGAVTTKPYFF